MDYVFKVLYKDHGIKENGYGDCGYHIYAVDREHALKKARCEAEKTAAYYRTEVEQIVIKTARAKWENIPEYRAFLRATA